GLAAWRLCRSVPRRLPVHRRRALFDYLGMPFLAAGAGALMLVLAWGGNLFPWASPPILALAAAAAAALALFASWERKAPDPLLPLHLFANPVFRSAGSIIFFAAMAMM